MAAFMPHTAKGGAFVLHTHRQRRALPADEVCVYETVPLFHRHMSINVDRTHGKRYNIYQKPGAVPGLKEETHVLTQISTKDAPAAVGPYSQAIRYGELLFASGQIPLDPQTGEIVGSDVTAQAHMVLQNLIAVLKAGGADLSCVVKATCFLADMADFAAFNEVYASYFTADPKPARSTIAVKGLPKGALCEVEAIAAVK